MLADATEMILNLAKTDWRNIHSRARSGMRQRSLCLGTVMLVQGILNGSLKVKHGKRTRHLFLHASSSPLAWGRGIGRSHILTGPVEFASPDGTMRLRIRGRIDRVDVTPEGQFLIYDYKSGREHPKAKDIEAGTALQLPLYLLAFEQITGSHGFGGGYYKIRRDVERNIVLADPSAKDLLVSRFRPSTDFTGMIRHSRECAFAYIDGIRNGRFPLPPERNARTSIVTSNGSAVSIRTGFWRPVRRPDMVATPRQGEAITRHDKSMVVTAGAGTGKTYVLVQKYIDLLKTKGVSVPQILALTFTDKAAAEMKERIRAEILKQEGPQWEKAAEDFMIAPVQTFHSFCAQVLREFPIEACLEPGFAVLDEQQVSRIHSKAYEDLIHTQQEGPVMKHWSTSSPSPINLT